MVFSTHIFIFYFLPAVLALYYAAPRWLRMPILTFSSYAFYGWTNPWFILLILWSTLVDFCCGNLIYGHWRLIGPAEQPADGEPRASSAQRKIFLVVSLLSNLGMLCFFKYFMFAADNLNRLLELFGKAQMDIPLVLLPAGISFYTFESISYNVDIYFGRAKPASTWVTRAHERRGGGTADGFWTRLKIELEALGAFACYITQFPHLVAGPIIRYQDLERQLHERTHTVEKVGRGIFFFALGLGKKILIANPVGELADAAFRAESLHWLDAWYGVFSYAFQIYFDFSGYSDMAIGLGLMFGFEFARNFDSPYKSQSITEFWRRWHISLSTWLRDYLYIPLGGNRNGEARTYFNLLVVMLLGGFWHGASWNFLVWGAIFGVWLALERLLGKSPVYAKLPSTLRMALTFLIVCVAWVFFRADDLHSATRYLGSLFYLRGEADPNSLLLRAIFYEPGHVLVMLVAAALAFFGIQVWDLSRNVTPLRASWALGVFAWSVIAMSAQSFNPFLYFQF
jgi:alginate O-acetyltransferase complex protein AlgI